MESTTERTQHSVPVPINAHESREAMILSYLPLVRLVAERVRRQLPFGIEIEPLIHSGVIGLLEALHRFNPERGVSFQAYAKYRIHGEMIQCLRSLDSVSRSARFWTRRIAAARHDLSTNLRREPSSAEVAGELGLELDTYHRVRSKVNECRPVQVDDAEAIVLDARVNDSAEHYSVSHADPALLVERCDLLEKMHEAVRLLPERERRVVELHHQEGLTLRKIGRLLGLTEGRISQIYNKARKSLREALG